MVESKPHYHVFLSHNSSDKGSVEPLAVMLKEKGLNPFLDKWNLVPGEPIEDALIEALENSDSAVIFVGPGDEGPWQSEEMRDILKRAVKSHNEFRAIPVLLPNASAEALEKSFLGSRLWIEFKDVDDDDALLRLAKAIKGEASGDESFKLPDEPAPYRGLERFERIEKPGEDFFFGRDDEIRALVERLVQQRFVAVVGASGSGKSSLIRAGLTKQLAEELHPGIRRWQTITVEPGSAPFRSLAVQIAVAAGIPVADREDWIEKSVEKWTAAPDGVRLSLETLFADAKEPLLVFIDQFEELFTHRREGQENEAISRNFVANLADIWRHGGDRLRVVMALRADFVERCLEIGPLKELLQDRTMLVGEVGDDALREIVKEPAARVGAFLEKGLMERILTEVRDQSGSLPLLEQALYELWRHRKGAWLTHEAFDASGGVARALNDQAQGAYTSLNDAQNKIADSLFPRLITLGEGVADTRRRVKRKELYPEGVEPGAVNAVIDTLSGKDARILVTTREGGTAEDLGSGEDFVEFTHEALLANWDHLVTLLDSERESIRKHRSLTTAAEEWKSQPQDEKEKFLLRAGQLVIAEQWAKDEGGYARLNQLERRFLDESVQERTAEEARKAKIARRLKLLSIGATAAAIVSVIIGAIALQQQTRATQAAIHSNLALVPWTRLHGLHRDSVFHAWAAYNYSEEQDPLALTARNLISNGSVFDPPLRHKSVVYSATFSPLGDKIVTASKDKTAQLWNAATGERIGDPIPHAELVRFARFSRDGTKVVTASYDFTARIVDATTGKTLRVLGNLEKDATKKVGHTDAIHHAEFSPDGTKVATGSADGTARLWEVETGVEIAKLEHEGNVLVRCASFSPDGSKLVTSSGGRAFLWELEANTLIFELRASPKNPGAAPAGEQAKAHMEAVVFALFSPDGERIATTSQDDMARLWNVEKGQEIKTLKHSSNVWSADFSPDGSTLVTADEAGTVNFWDAKTGERKGVKLIHEGLVRSVKFSGDGKRVVTASYDGTARVWHVATGKQLAKMGHGSLVRHAEFGPEKQGTRIVTASQDGTARVWKVKTPASLGEPDQYHSVFDPSGDRVATAHRGGTATIWDHATRKKLLELKGHKLDIRFVAFSRDGKKLVTAAGRRPPTGFDNLDHTALVWDAATGAILSMVEGQEEPEEVDRNGAKAMELKLQEISSAAFSRDGLMLVTGSGRLARIWDVRTQKAVLLETLHHTEKVNFVDFSPEGKQVATASGMDAFVWNLENGLEKAEWSVQHNDIVWFVGFSPDGAKLLTTSQDSTAQLWEKGQRLEKDEKAQYAGKALLDEPIKMNGHINYAGFSPSGDRIVTAGQDEAVQLWDAHAGHALGDPYFHHLPVRCVAFSRHGDQIITTEDDELGTGTGVTRLWNVPLPAAADPERLRLSVEVRTGFHLNQDGRKRTLNLQEWKKRKEKLKSFEGPFDVRP